MEVGAESDIFNLVPIELATRRMAVEVLYQDLEVAVEHL